MSLGVRSRNWSYSIQLLMLATIVLSTALAALPQPVQAAALEGLGIAPQSADAAPVMSQEVVLADNLVTEAEAQVNTLAALSAELEAPPPAELSYVVDPRNPYHITYFGTEAGRRFLAPRPTLMAASTSDVEAPGGDAYVMPVPDANNDITAMAAAPDGRLFVGISGAGLRVYGPNAEGIYAWTPILAQAGQLASNAVTALAVLGNELWVGTQDAGASALNLDDGTWQTLNTANSDLPSNAIIRITAVTAPNGDGYLWFSTMNGAARYNADAGMPWTILTQAQGLPGNEIDDVAVRFAGSSTLTYIGTADGAAAWNGSSVTEIFGDVSKGCWLDRAIRIVVDNAGAVWFVAQQDFPELVAADAAPEAINGLETIGVCRLDPSGVWSFYNANLPGLPTNLVSDLNVDGAGRVWMSFYGTDVNPGGGAAYDQGSWLILQQSGDPFMPVSSSRVLPVGDAVWFADAQTASLSVFSVNWRRFGPAQIQGDGDPGPVLVTPDTIWTAAGTVLSFLDESLTWTPVQVPSGGSVVTSLALDQDGLIWIGTAGGGVLSYAGANEFTQQTSAGDLPSDDVRDLLIDSQNRVWAATANGLALQGNGYWLAFDTVNSGIASNDLTALAEDNIGRIWIGTAASGLSVFTPDANGGDPWTTYTTADGLPADSIRDIETVTGSKMAVATASGVAEWDSGSDTWTADPGDGLPGDDARAIASDPTGVFWTGTTSGLAVRQGDEWAPYHVTGSMLGGDHIQDVDTGDQDTWISAGEYVSVRKPITGPIGDFPPVVNDFTPDSGPPVNTIVTIQGDHFDERGPYYNTVSFCCLNGHPIPWIEAQVYSATKTSLQVEVPETAATGPIRVEAHGLATNTAQVYTVEPFITGIYGNCLIAGSVLRLTGYGFAGAGNGGAYVKVGNGDWHVADMWNATEIHYYIRPGDTSGPVRVRLGQNGPQTVGYSDVTVANLKLDRARIQQDIEGQPMIWGKRTLVQLFLKADAPGDGCLAWFSSGKLEWKKTDGSLEMGSYDLFQPGNLSLIVHDEAEEQVMDDAVNFVAEFNSNRSLYTDIFPLSQFNGVRVTLKNGWMEAFSVDIPRNQFAYTDSGRLIHWHFVPITPNSFTSSEYQAYYDAMEIATEQMARMYPQEDTTPYAGEPVWLQHMSNPYKVGDAPFNYAEEDYEYFDTLKCMVDDKREFANDHRCSSSPGSACYYHLNYSVGVIAGKLQKDGSPDGSGRSGDHSALIYHEPDDIAFPIAHEASHMYGLVPAERANHDDDNSAHSKYDEGEVVDGCSESLTFRQALIDQTGASRRVVRLDDGAPFEFPMTGCGDGDKMPRSIMSYVADRSDTNGFYEPLDAQYIQAIGLGVGSGWIMNPSLAAASADANDAGRAFRFAGVIDNTDQVTVTLSYLLDSVIHPLSPPNEDGRYRLQFRSAGGDLLSEHRFDTNHVDAHTGGIGRLSRFALRLQFPEATQIVELRAEDQVVWSRPVSANAPTVSFTSPTGGDFAADGTVPIAWTASDPDNDTLSFALEYTPNDGQAWQQITPVEFGMSYHWQPGWAVASAVGRLRIQVSDGFNTATALSEPFVLAAQAPIAVIVSPGKGESLTEGSVTELRGSSFTSSGRRMGDFTWTEGAEVIGVGQAVTRTLDEVGVHVIALEVEDHGLTGSTTVSITVLPDYDRDRVPNAWEQAYQFNPLDQLDASGDADGDGLSNWREYTLATNPRQVDSDGDGRSDGQEVNEGSNPLEPDEAPPVNPDANHSPDAVDDTLAALPNQQTVLGVLVNDSDPDSDALAIYALGQPAHGTIATDGHTISYRPHPGYAGEDTFTYAVWDKNGGADAAWVTVTVPPAGPGSSTLFFPNISR